MSKGLKIFSMFVVSMIGVAAAVLLGRNDGAARYGGSRRKTGPTRGGRTSRADRADAPRYEDMTRSELYERAREMEVPQRSKMTRDELVEALKRRSS